ncbi:DNA cytosine methyltransferase [Vibrio cholerae]|uniref:DNA cytosine methyltransferase n=1 Tax=Vibrio cholerae TaxID=666 RepID=UPI000BA93128|nr:DNA cytosine methyltransferase [Vibrio cholerae]EIB4934407.1 DNA cytosine methyltransferase [Vibrio cholerae]EJL6713369.1 DNA cytosine methyltransferase [Vibrio cholerae]EMC2458315.1 DNA cytosine methyltransferase [Vibrio cholerae]PAS19151.1 DNA (cytosine-5-)-methyltransferase [Vibrio cholerae]PAS22730.1 DNA (cytosine-5-)-methyltransferase [Vibrio cholerae]
MKVFDLFCGTGGFTKGFENSTKAEFDVKFGIDILDASVETFKLNHKGAVGLSKDIRQVRRHEVEEMTGIKRGELDVLVGGPPCQGFSSIRPFRSTNDDDPRNSLFEEYASFVNYFRPKVFILENVVGLATHKKGHTLEVMQECFHQIGYETDWKLLNAAHFGVPQKRERFVMVGVERGAKIMFPKPTHSYNGATIGFKDKTRILAPESDENVLPKAISAMEAIDDLPPISSGETTIHYTSEPRTDYQKSRRKGTRELSLHIATKHSEKMMEIIRHSGKNINCIPKHLITSGFSSCYSRLDADEPAVTITVNFVHPASNRCIHPTLHRALTPREGARLQSFDDDFKFYGTRTQITKQIGNAVPPLLGQAIADTIAEMGL